MALETLKDLKEIDGFEIRHAEHCVHDRELSQDYIMVDHHENMVSFKIQDGPIKEKGINGCQVDTLIATASFIIEGLNKKFPCKENDKVLEHLHSAYNWTKKRKRNREQRGVEGRNLA